MENIQSYDFISRMQIIHKKQQQLVNNPLKLEIERILSLIKKNYKNAIKLEKQMIMELLEKK
jgi:hypothetical protein